MIEPKTLPELIERCWQRFERQEHYGRKVDGAWAPIATATVRDAAGRLAAGLAASGVRRGDRVAIIADTCYEWALSDYAALSLGAVVVPVYPTLTAEQTGYILGHAGVRLALVADEAQWRKVAAVQHTLDQLEEVIVFDPPALADGDAPPPTSLEQLMARAAAGSPEPSDRPGADDLASIIYTSGTTGEPKGVMLTHANIVSNVLSCTAACPYRPEDLHLTFLPLSHIFERMVHYYMLWNGVSVYFVEDLAKVRDNMVEVRPTILTAVPRVLEKVLAAVEQKGQGNGLAPRLTRFAIGVAHEYAQAVESPDGVKPGLAIRRAIAERLVFRKVRALLGGRVHSIVTGGAATPLFVTEFFRGIGVGLIPGYGLTEASPVIAFNTPTHFRFGSVGRPIPDVEVRIADDGEILARGPNIMRGYFRNDEATRAAIDDDGWLRTGDIGRLEDGYLYITDRKKDLLVTAGGKNIAPQPIEERLAQDPFIAQAMLIGDARPYVAALVVPSFPALEQWARERSIPSDDRARLVAHPEVFELYRGRLDSACGHLANYERVKRFVLLDAEFGEAEMTPTLKLKRRIVVELRRDLIESLYA